MSFVKIWSGLSLWDMASYTCMDGRSLGRTKKEILQFNLHLPWCVFHTDTVRQSACKMWKKTKLLYSPSYSQFNLLKQKQLNFHQVLTFTNLQIHNSYVVPHWQLERVKRMTFSSISHISSNENAHLSTID